MPVARWQDEPELYDPELPTAGIQEHVLTNAEEEELLGPKHAHHVVNRLAASASELRAALDALPDRKPR